MRHAGEDLHGDRVRALIVILWRAGLRSQEALSLTDSTSPHDTGQPAKACP